MKRLMSILATICLSGFIFAANSQEEVVSKLITAVKCKDKGRVQHLLTYNKVDVNALYKGRTALDVAVDHGATKIAKVLMKHGAKVTTEENALALRRMFKMRAVNFFVAGLFFTPWLWIGSFIALSDMPHPYAMILQK